MGEAEEKTQVNQEKSSSQNPSQKKARISPLLKEIAYTFKKPATERYPFEKPVIAEGFRGKLMVDFNLCVGCGLCSRECPAKAIELVQVENKMRPKFMLDRCIFCNQCVENCPKHAIQNTSCFEMATLDKSSLVIDPQKKAD